MYGEVMCGGDVLVERYPHCTPSQGLCAGYRTHISHGEALSTSTRGLLGGVAAFGVMTATMPLEVVMRRMQVVLLLLMMMGVMVVCVDAHTTHTHTQLHPHRFKAAPGIQRVTQVGGNLRHVCCGKRDLHLFGGGRFHLI